MTPHARRSLLCALAAAWALAACSGADLTVTEEPTSASTDPITFVDQTKVERQTIGNCWVYAGASWLEALHLKATGEALDTSQSYTTYWSWFERIANSGEDHLDTAGSFPVFVRLLARYGVMKQADFIPEEDGAEASGRQSAAQAEIERSLAEGALSTAAARKDRALVRAELDRAWALSADTVALLDKVFGKKVERTLDLAYPLLPPAGVTTASGAKRVVLRPLDIVVWGKNPSLNRQGRATLADVAGLVTWTGVSPYAWKEAKYPSDAKGRRALQKRVQAALHDHQPVIVSWLVDFNAMTSDGAFTLEALQKRGRPGHQGGHFVVMHDYEVDNVPGYGTLPAGADETRPDALAKALDDAATVRFFRVKNSWGDYKSGAIKGYHDLHLTYLDGPIAACDDAGDCQKQVAPLRAVVLPGGY